MDGFPDRGANMVDLVNYAVRNKKKEPPLGVTQLTHALHKVGFPREFIANHHLQRAINEVFIGSPRLTSSLPKTSTPPDAVLEHSRFFDVSTLMTEDEDNAQIEEKKKER